MDFQIDRIKTEPQKTWLVTWNGNKPFVVTESGWLIASMFPGCTLEPVSEKEVRKIERREYESELALRKLKKAKR